MRIAFRVDASYRIGSGHVMRCLTLAEELRRRGDEITFVSRALPGHLFAAIETAGFALRPLDAPPTVPWVLMGDTRQHIAWLGIPPDDDAADTVSALESTAPFDWLVVDHYALDWDWEVQLRPHVRRIAVIDDLADRRHDADLLLDPTLGRKSAEYRALLPAGVRMLLGPEYAPLRPEFVASRPDALARRRNTLRPRRLLVSLGGADPDGATMTVLASLADADLPEDLEIEAVLGVNAVNPDAVRRATDALPRVTEVTAGVSGLAARMVRADLAVGAAGTTAWERCCLGLPTVVITIADNQRRIAGALEQAGAIQWLGELGAVSAQPGCVGRAVAALLADPEDIRMMARAASAVTDGLGCVRAADVLHDLANARDESTG